MRQTDIQESRAQWINPLLQIDFHDFTKMASWMDDVELAEEFHIGIREAEALRRKIQRS